jgi:hypothetical protein
MPTVGLYARVPGVLTVVVRIFLPFRNGVGPGRKEAVGEAAINWNLFVFRARPPNILSDTMRRLAAAPSCGEEATMRLSLINRLAVAAVLAGSLAAPVAVRAQDQGIPVMTLRAALRLPPDQLPTMFRSPNPYQHEPYNIHRTDGLSRNPDDCMRWGCIDHR